MLLSMDIYDFISCITLFLLLECLPNLENWFNNEELESSMGFYRLHDFILVTMLTKYFLLEIFYHVF
jgi:hypothetical protein